MELNMTIQTVIWVAMATAVGALALYRKYISRAEIDVVHLSESESPLLSRQEVFARRLGIIDRWGKLLTIILIAYGVSIVCGYLFLAWHQSIQSVS
jgi:hypothetical protein